VSNRRGTRSRGAASRPASPAARRPGKPVPIGSTPEPDAPPRQRSRRSAPARRSSPDGDSYRVDRLAKSRFGIVYDIDGPRVRLGVAWFVAAIATAYLGLLPLALLVAAIAAVAAAQTAQALRTKWCRPSRATAAAIAGAIPLAAAVGTGLAGLVVIVAAIASVVLANMRRPRRTDPIVDGGAVIRASLFVGLAAASLVMLYRVDIGAAVTLLVVLSAYECGDYLIGSGASNMVEGPFSGFLAVVVVAGAAAVIQPPPFTALGLWLYALVAAATAPVGQIAASAILPRAGATAPALRRLDSYLVAGPVWLVLLWSGVGI
jgi:hypothetical protein